MKTLVIGLDGACWDLIDEWVESGELPNIKMLKERGCWGPMQSCIPPITCPAWHCYATGKNPGKLGVFWWEHLDLQNRKVITPNSNSFKSRDLWDYLNDAGYKTGVIGMPTTYPPKKVDGFMISGGPDCSDTGYTYPRELEPWLRRKFDYKPHPLVSLTSPGERDNAIKEVQRIISLNFEVAKELTEKHPVDFLQVTSFDINAPLQHYFYNSEPTRKAWNSIDEKIGELVPGFDYVLIMSDHGTSPVIKNFFINAWLERQGYLVRHQTGYDLLLKLGLKKSRILNLLSTLSVIGFVRRFKIAQRVASQLFDPEDRLGRQQGQGTFSRIDWKKTRVVGSPQGPIYINRNLVKSHDDYENLRAELINKLQALRDPDTGKNVIQKVYKREEAYHGDYAQQAPDLIALDSDEYHNRGGIGRSEILKTSDWQGNNARNGLFLFAGHGIRQNKRLEGITIFDLAPTILHLMAVPIPDDMDGRVLEEIFQEGSEPARRDVRRLSGAGEKERIVAKIEDLKRGGKT